MGARARALEVTARAPLGDDHRHRSRVRRGREESERDSARHGAALRSGGADVGEHALALEPAHAAAPRDARDRARPRRRRLRSARAQRRQARVSGRGTVLRFVASAAPTSMLVFTYIHRAVLDGRQDFEGAAKARRQPCAPRRAVEVRHRSGGARGVLAALRSRGRGRPRRDEYRQRYRRGRSDFRGYAFYRIAVASVSRSRPNDTPRGSAPSAR